jgi:hypothetical protein
VDGPHCSGRDFAPHSPIRSTAQRLPHPLSSSLLDLNLRLPRVSSGVLKLSARNVSEPAISVTPSRECSGGSGGADEGGITARAFEPYQAVQKGEVNMSFVFLGVCALAFLNAITLLVFKSKSTATPGP